MQRRLGKTLVWIIKYTDSASKQLKKLDRQVALRILDFMDERVASLDDPRALRKKLVGPRMGDYWRFRVGDIRIICNLVDHELCVLVLEVAHRREVYR